MHLLRVVGASSLAALCLRCAEPRAALRDLEAFDDGRSPGIQGYARTPQPGAPPIDDPVEFALGRIATLAAAGADELDAIERARAIEVCARLVLRDPSRIVRAQALRALSRLGAARLPAHAAVEEATFDEPALDAALAPALSALQGGAFAEFADWRSTLQALRAQQRETTALAGSLCRLSARCAAAAPSHEAAAEFAGLAHTFALQAAFTAAGSALADAEPLVRARALAVLLDLELAVATQIIGTRYQPALKAGLLRTELLRLLAQRPGSAPSVHPALRRELRAELESPDAAVCFHARRSLAVLLSLDPEAAGLPQVRAAWDSLGDWDARRAGSGPR